MLIRRDTALARRGGVLGGCLVILGLIAVLLIAGGVYVSMSWRGWVSDISVQGIQQGLNESELSEEEKSEIMVLVQDLADDFKAGDVTLEEIGKIAEELVDGPILPIAAVYGAQKAYFDASGLTEEEKSNAQLQMQRLARGVFEKKISMDEMQDAIDDIAVQTGENDWHIREPEVVSDEDLRDMVRKITVLTDEKEIPAEPFEVDISKEVDLAIKRGRGQIVEEPHDGDVAGEHAGQEHAEGEHEGEDAETEHESDEDAAGEQTDAGGGGGGGG